MSDLVAMSFDDEFKASEVVNTLAKLQKAHLIDLEDAAVIVKNSEGKVKLKQTQNLVAAGAVSGGFWGLLFGTLFLSPLLGAAVGAATGALSGKATDLGINDEFMKELGATLTPGTSAIFVLVRKATPDRVIEELKPFNGKIMRTSLSVDDEEKLKAALGS
ncbi:DUF1269 domain-containing protein [Lyngbya sp. PCC 8106]|uniref:DUF1269 domain-containing protein n=1 Tax=Lyngbya sp. (strain PCC 8106) TaxID=313612 RepID=UPI0000EAC66F|nr:DUF1269 domain-containing protein [Lyngbya sp. PCC 8106]EAW38472.1 hypothetical protein L8106_06714 [Lyngbya sp. PCC 8106]